MSDDETTMEGGLLNLTKIGLQDKSLSKTSLKIKKSKRGKKYITIKGKKLYLTTLLKRINKKRVKEGKKPYKAINKRNLENTLLQLLFKDKILEKEKTKKGKSTRLKRPRGFRATAAQKRAAREEAFQKEALKALRDLQPSKVDFTDKEKQKEDKEKFISSLPEALRDSESVKDLFENIDKKLEEEANQFRTRLDGILNRIQGEKKKRFTEEERDGFYNVIKKNMYNTDVGNFLTTFYDRNRINKTYSADTNKFEKLYQLILDDNATKKLDLAPADIKEILPKVKKHIANINEIERVRILGQNKINIASQQQSIMDKLQTEREGEQMSQVDTPSNIEMKVQRKKKEEKRTLKGLNFYDNIRKDNIKNEERINKTLSNIDRFEKIKEKNIKRMKIRDALMDRTPKLLETFENPGKTKTDLVNVVNTFKKDINEIMIKEGLDDEGKKKYNDFFAELVSSKTNKKDYKKNVDDFANRIVALPHKAEIINKQNKAIEDAKNELLKAQKEQKRIKTIRKINYV